MAWRASVGWRPSEREREAESRRLRRASSCSPVLPPSPSRKREHASLPTLSSLQQLRLRARALYKELYHLGREYPDPAYGIHARLHRCFLAHVGAEREKVEEGIRKAEFIKAELEAMYSLRKYRAMKQRYYDEPPRNTE